MKLARFVKQCDGFQGDARLYSLDPPLPVRDWNGKDKGAAEHVVVSANRVMFSGPETYIFKADERGEILDWSELDGSFRGGLDHERALSGAGYTVVKAES